MTLSYPYVLYFHSSCHVRCQLIKIVDIILESTLHISPSFWDIRNVSLCHLLDPTFTLSCLWNAVIRLLGPYANPNKHYFLTNNVLLSCVSPISIYITQIDSCSAIAFWDKHQLPETEILIWCHAASIRTLHAYVYPYLLSQNAQKHGAYMVLLLRHYKWPH